MAAHIENEMRVTRKARHLNGFNGMRNAARTFWNVFIVGGIVLGCPRLSTGQHVPASAQHAREPMSCHQKVLEPGATGGGLVQVDGFTVEVKPIEADVPNSMVCRATIRSAEGKIVFEHEEWDIEMDPITGKDVNGDGYADAVLVSYSGGAHCCWTYHIVSLGRNPGLIAEF